MNKLFWSLFGGVLLWSLSAQAVSLTIQTQTETLPFEVEIATTPLQQMRGLMFRESLVPNAGMFFGSPEEKIWNMWMRNTLISLDIIFVARTGEIVKIISKAKPKDETILSSDIPVVGVLEIGGGQAQKKGIAVGDKLIFKSDEITFIP